MGCTRAKENILVYQSESLLIYRMSGQVYRHVSYLDTETWGKVPCNGMIVDCQHESLVIDTPTDNKTSLELINWIRESLKSKIIAIVPAHYHEDNLGGLNEFHRQGISSYASYRTIQICKDKNLSQPLNGFDNYLELKVGKEKVDIIFLGEGHTCDNIIAYLPTEKIMFGGCLVKSIGASKGNLEEANTQEWPKTIRKALEKYPDIKEVIPGHGEPGGIELLNYTIKLFEEK